MKDHNAEQPLGYADMAVRLHALAAAANDPAIAVQLIDLATRYELVAATATEMSEKAQPIAPQVPSRG